MKCLFVCLFSAEELTYDAMTPDSGVHENFATLTTEEQEKQREDWKADLAKVSALSQLRTESTHF